MWGVKSKTRDGKLYTPFSEFHNKTPPKATEIITQKLNSLKKRLAHMSFFKHFSQDNMRSDSF